MSNPLYAFPAVCEQTLRALARYPQRTAFSWPGGSLTYPQYAEAVVGILEGGLNGGAERMQHIPIRKSKPTAGKQDV